MTKDIESDIDERKLELDGLRMLMLWVQSLGPKAGRAERSRIYDEVLENADLVLDLIAGWHFLHGFHSELRRLVDAQTERTR